MIRDFMVAPAIGGTNETGIEDFKFESDQNLEPRKRRKKPILAVSDCGDGDFADTTVKVCSQERKSKLLLNEDYDEIDIGIGKVTPPKLRSESEDEEEDWRCLRKMGARRRSSPLRRLLTDVDVCLVNFFENIYVSEDSQGPHERDAALKTEALNESAAANLQ